MPQGWPGKKPNIDNSARLDRIHGHPLGSVKVNPFVPVKPAANAKCARVWC